LSLLLERERENPQSACRADGKTIGYDTTTHDMRANRHRAQTILMTGDGEAAAVGSIA